MTKWLILLLAVALLVIVYLVTIQFEFTPPWAQPKFGEVTRGDIRVPITASGLIHAAMVIEVKSQASGEIVDVPVVEGDYVRKDETLVVLDPDDEQRAVDRAQAEYERAQAALRQAQVAVKQADISVDNAEARLEEMKARADITAFELNKIRGWEEQGRTDLYTPQQLHDAQAQHAMNVALKQQAEVAIRSAKMSTEDAEAVVQSQEAIVRSAKKALEDAEERLSETTVRATQDGIVTEVYVKAGMLVQSGTQSLTGGTPLMKIADIATKKVIARLDEADYGRVLDISPLTALPEEPGLREAAAAGEADLEQRSGNVTLTVDAFPEDRFAGRIDRVEPQGKLNPGSSIIQFDVHVVISDQEAHLLPLGAQAQVEFTVESASDVLRVPADAVKSLEEQRGIYLQRPPAAGEKYGRKFLPCRFGITDGEFTQIVSVIGGEMPEVGTKVYTQLPPDTDERGR